MKEILKFNEYIKENLDIPRILYHSSDNLFNKFELRNGYRTHLLSVEKTESLGIFFTDDINLSHELNSDYLYKCEVNVNRVLDWRSHLDARSYEYIKRKLGDVIPYHTNEYWILLDDKNVVSYLINRGIDCVILDEIYESDVYTTYCIFDVDKIKIKEIIKNERN